MPQNKKKKKKTEESEENQPSTWEVTRYILTSPAILFLFLFYCLNHIAGGGLKNFAIAGLAETHDTNLAIANAAFTAFLVASAAGVLVGGWIADRTRHHEAIAVVGLGISAVVVLLVGVYDLPGIVLVTIFAFAGLVNGLIGPARDMLIRRASPKGSMGKVFGFVFSGQTIGSAVAPLLFGMMIDYGLPAWIFYASAIFTVFCMIVIMISARFSRSAPVVPTTAAKPAE